MAAVGYPGTKDIDASTAKKRPPSATMRVKCAIQDLNLEPAD
jgi:hypothetical protein